MENERQQKIESFLKSSQIDVLKEEEQVVVLGGNTVPQTTNSGNCTATTNSHCNNSGECGDSTNRECTNSKNCSGSSGPSSGGADGGVN